MSNVNISELVKDLTTSTLTFQDLWYKLTGSFPCISCLTIKLLGKPAPNLLSFLHYPSSIGNNINNEGLYSEFKTFVIDELDRNPFAFTWKHNTFSHPQPQSNKGWNWRKSACIKKYCECFQANKLCSQFWKWIGCKNCAKNNQNFEFDYIDRSNSSASTSTSDSLLKSLSLSFIKGFEGSNNNTDSKSLNPLNSLCAILNTKHDVPHLSSPDSMAKEKSFLSTNLIQSESPDTKKLVSSTFFCQKTQWIEYQICFSTFTLKRIKSEFTK